MGAGAELAVKIGKVVLANVVGYLIYKAVKNKINGKTVFGDPKARKTKDDTYVDWHGNVVLGSRDGWVV